MNKIDHGIIPMADAFNVAIGARRRRIIGENHITTPESIKLADDSSECGTDTASGPFLEPRKA